MIAANELRIGNWVECTDIMRVVAIHNRYVQFKDDSDYVVFPIPLSSINPIPLTPEILEKCGFVKYNNYNVYVHYRNGTTKNHIKLLKNNEKNEYAFLSVGPELEFPYIYLHQLQNLYFALTGEELNVNL